MGCNCNNTEKNYTNFNTSAENNMQQSDNFLLGSTGIVNNNPEDYNHRYQPEQPLLKFLASKRPCEDLEAAKNLINRRRPPLVLGQPAVVQYYDENDNIRLLFCIGAAPDSSAIMFQITDEGGGVPSSLVERIVALEEQMAVVDASIEALKAKDIQQDISINLALNTANDVSAKVSTYDASIASIKNTADDAKQTAEDVSVRVGTFDSRISAAEAKAAEAKEDASTAKQIALDVSANVGTFDSRITEAQSDASIAKKIAVDVSTSVSKYDTSINIAVAAASEAKTIAVDVSSKVSNYDNSINIAVNTAQDASAVAYDVSSKITPEGMQLIVQYLIDNKLINNIDASTAKDSSNAEYALDASTANFATNATNADRASYATYADSCQSATRAT